MIRNVAYILILLLLFGIVGKMDFEEAQMQEAYYCQNVANGIWPDYNKTYKHNCFKNSFEKQLTAEK